jgi:hypothetical protein
MAQRLTTRRTPWQRFRRWSRTTEPGKPSRRTVFLLYVLLAFLVVVDYTILTQAFILIQASQSTSTNSIASSQALIVLAVSLAAVFLPHAAAWGLQRRALGVLAPYARWIPWAAIVLWAILVLMVTVLRLVAANTTIGGKTDNTVQVPGAVATPAAPEVADPIQITDFFDLGNPAVMLAYFMLLILIVSALMAFLVATVAHNPLRSARHASEGQLKVAQEEADSRAVELKVATDALEVARAADRRDQERLKHAQDQLQHAVQSLRSEVRTILAASLGSPEATSQLMRELARRYSPAAPSAAPGPKGAES